MPPAWNEFAHVLFNGYTQLSAGMQLRGTKLLRTTLDTIDYAEGPILGSLRNFRENFGRGHLDRQCRQYHVLAYRTKPGDQKGAAPNENYISG